jgi:hypothetical protein
MDQEKLQRWMDDWFTITQRCFKLYDLSMTGDARIHKYRPIMKTNIKYCHHKDFLCMYRKADMVDQLFCKK